MADDKEEIPKPKVASLKGCFTPAAKARIEKFLGSFESFEPTLGLLYGDVDGRVAGKPSWSITAFDPRTVDDTIDMYASFGAVVCYDFDDLRIMVPQIAHISELEGVELDFVANRLCPTGASRN